MIESLPTSWRDLQERVARILNECGIDTSVEKQVTLARGRAKIDVWAYDASSVPPQTYIIECKRWFEPVPQTVVHAFRSVVGDCGANWGAIVSCNGFQSGAYEAAQYSNVRLLTWYDFLALFETAWFDRYFCRIVAEASEPLIEYTETINSRIFRKADLLSKGQHEEFKRLRSVHFSLAAICMMMRVQANGALRLVRGDHDSIMLDIPLRQGMRGAASELLGTLPNSILDADSYRILLSAIIEEVENAIASFDHLFGERA
ncbi:MAG: restriction endonuclease [Cyanobacteriota bacterium]|nr:restriction endonuclease [Cyanobacteriota bacterium]